VSRSNLGQRLVDAIARDTGSDHTRLLDAFAAVPRERFLGPPPWLIAKPPLDGATGATYVETSDVADVYANVSVALDASRQLFNGAPGTVAGWLEALNPRSGERAFHAGCGSGYFTAVLATLVGPKGSVVAADVDESLVDQADEALADFPNVSLLTADATAFAPDSYDVGLVNMGVSVIPDLWLTRLAGRNGRLAIPLTVPLPGRDAERHLSKGFVFLIERSGSAYTARVIGGVIIFSASGSANEAAQRRLMRSLNTSNPGEVRSLRRDAHASSETCWLHEERYCLSRDSNSA
jgi:protein-L-isoaspartate(D-aspartate) O-methyltransferase